MEYLQQDAEIAYFRANLDLPGNKIHTKCLDTMSRCRLSLGSSSRELEKNALPNSIRRPSLNFSLLIKFAKAYILSLPRP